MSDLSPQMMVERLDAVSRTRALSELESIALEKAIRALDGEPDIRCTKRDAARAGLKRDMRVYSRSERELRRKIDGARVGASLLKGKGEHFYAEQVLELCRAAEGLRETCSRLHADNKALRLESSSDCRLLAEKDR